MQSYQDDNLIEAILKSKFFTEIPHSVREDSKLYGELALQSNADALRNSMQRHLTP